MTSTRAQGDLVSNLAVLDREERALSSLRRDLHEQIDRLYLSAPLDDAQITTLDLLENPERDVSARRHALHRRINELRVQAGQETFRRERPPQPHRVFCPDD
jgi:hypothetical protein